MNTLFVTRIVLLAVMASSLRTAMAQPEAAANKTLSFGGKAITIDMTSCSPENSSNGKNRAIAAINSPSASSATVQFATLNPATGAYATVIDEDALGAGKVILGAGGSAFGGVLIAKAGQTINVTKTGTGYRASFSNLTLVDMQNQTSSAKTLTGSFGCQ